MKRILLLILLLLVVLTGVAPLAAQSADPVDWIPADFTGFVRLDMTEAQITLNDLNLSLFVAAVLQPVRFQYPEAQGFDSFFPLDSFDMEDASFSQSVLPWLRDEVIVAYRQLGAQFNATSDETLLILPSRDAFMSASFLQAIVEEQDLRERETYRDVIIYNGDKTSFAFLPTAVLVGADELIHAALDTMTGNAAAFSASPVYQQVRDSLPDTGLITAYVSGDAAARSLGVLLSGGAGADPLLGALDEALGGVNDDQTPARLLLSGSLDGLGVSVHYDPVRSNNLEAEVVLHTVAAPAPQDSAFDPAVLALVPRSAMIVQSGADASSTASAALYTVPFLGFGSQLLASFQPTSATPAAPLPTPTAEDITAAVENFLITLQSLVDVQGDLLTKLTGSYSLALLPRPNNPLPGTSLPFDLLLIAQTDSKANAETAQATVNTLLETFVAPLDDDTLDDYAFRTLRDATGETLVSIGAVDNLLVIGTGSAAQQALNARNGDNQLIQQARWQNLSQNDQIPYLYVDVNAYYNTFMPTLGGPAVRPVGQLGVQSSYLGDNLFQLHLLVALTQ